MIVRAAARYHADFYIEKDQYQINGKSIIGVMTLAAEQGAELRLIFVGEDAESAANDVVALFDNGFGEEL